MNLLITHFIGTFDEERESENPNFIIEKEIERKREEKHSEYKLFDKIMPYYSQQI